MIKADELCTRFGLAPYQRDAFVTLLSRTELVGKRVLEVGGSNIPSELAIGEFGAREWVSVDLISEGTYQLHQQSAHYSAIGIKPISQFDNNLGSAPYSILDGKIEDATRLPSSYFDVILSITSFEHIIALPLALEQMKRLKKDHAPIFTYHGPLWSCYCGHHIWVDQQINFVSGDAIPPHWHLLKSPPELFLHLQANFGAQRAMKAVMQVYHEPRINRLFFEDYIAYFNGSGFSTIDVSSYGDVPLQSDIVEKLEKKFPDNRNFSAYGMVAYLV